MKESHIRSLVKAASWRIFATLVTMAIVFIFTGKVKLMIGVGLADIVSKLILYYLHERIWNKIGYGRKAVSKSA